MARFLADLEGKKDAEYKIHTLAGTIIPVVRDPSLLDAQRRYFDISTAVVTKSCRAAFAVGRKYSTALFASVACSSLPPAPFPFNNISPCVMNSRVE